MLNDVERLCTEHIDAWLSTLGMSYRKIAAFYEDESKRAFDHQALDDAEYRRRFGTNRTLRWGIHRWKQYALIALSGVWPSSGLAEARVCCCGSLATKLAEASSNGTGETAGSGVAASLPAWLSSPAKGASACRMASVPP